MSTFVAVQCFSCGTFQNHGKTLKKKKWKCVICNEKQSFVKIYARLCAASMAFAPPHLLGPRVDCLYCVSTRGKAKDIRKVVQRLNKNRLCPEEQQIECQFGAGSEDSGHDECHGTRSREPNSPQNRWKEYLDSPDGDSDSDGQKSRSILASRYMFP